MTTDSTTHSRKRIVPLIALLLINTGVAALIITQVHAAAVPKSLSLVKDESVVATDAGTIDESEEASIPAINVTDGPTYVITTYTVSSGDTISSIATKFAISQNTIRWANDLTAKNKLKVGDKLTILPVTGIEYTVKKGDTLGGIALKFDASSDEIASVNDIENAKLKIGAVLVIPDAEPAPVKAAPAKTTKVSPATKVTPAVETASVKADTVVADDAKEDVKDETPIVKTSSSYSMPVPGAILTQGIHGTNGVDFGTPVGSSVRAAMAGTVIVAKGNGAYNGGYGNYIVIEHPNGTQTLYAHLSKVEVNVGDSVDQNEHIALSGNTGKSTGPHLHFEVRGATNPFGDDKLMTHY